LLPHLQASIRVEVHAEGCELHCTTHQRLKVLPARFEGQTVSGKQRNGIAIEMHGTMPLKALLNTEQFYSF